MASPAQIQFYHLTRDRADRVLPVLLGKALAGKMRSLVKCATAAEAAQLNDWLWNYDPASFLPHGIAAGNENDAEHPVLLSDGPIDATKQEDRTLLFVLDQTELSPTLPYSKIFLLFDGADEAALTHARGQWKALKEAGAPITYWQQSPEGWQAKARENQEAAA